LREPLSKTFAVKEGLDDYTSSQPYRETARDLWFEYDRMVAEETADSWDALYEIDFDAFLRRIDEETEELEETIREWELNFLPSLLEFVNEIWKGELFIRKPIVRRPGADKHELRRKWMARDRRVNGSFKERKLLAGYHPFGSDDAKATEAIMSRLGFVAVAKADAAACDGWDEWTRIGDAQRRLADKKKFAFRHGLEDVEAVAVEIENLEFKLTGDYAFDEDDFLPDCDCSRCADQDDGWRRDVPGSVAEYNMFADDLYGF